MFFKLILIVFLIYKNTIQNISTCLSGSPLHRKDLSAQLNFTIYQLHMIAIAFTTRTLTIKLNIWRHKERRITSVCSNVWEWHLFDSAAAAVVGACWNFVCYTDRIWVCVCVYLCNIINTTYVYIYIYFVKPACIVLKITIFSWLSCGFGTYKYTNNNMLVIWVTDSLCIPAVVCICGCHKGKTIRVVAYPFLADILFCFIYFKPNLYLFLFVAGIFRII